MTKFQEHIYNASYLAIFLYGMRRIVRRIRPISFDDAYDLVAGLINRPGEHIFLVNNDGTYYHVANAPEKYLQDVVGCIANSVSSIKSIRNQWRKVLANTSGEKLNKVVWNTPLTRILPPEFHNRIPVIAQNLKKAYGESK